MPLLELPKSEFAPLDDELLPFLSDEERKAYTIALRRHLAMQSPLDLAEQMFPETQRWPQIELLNAHLVALAEYRLTASGPGLPGTTEIEFDDHGNLVSLTCLYRPEKAGPSGPALPERVPVVTRLTISMRPRAGKSFIVNKAFPLWLLLQDPDIAIAVGTYSDTFSWEWGEQMRDATIEAGHELPFLPQPDGGARAARDTFKVKDHKGRINYAGVGGALSGKGFQAMIGDDFIKNDQDAQSASVRKAAKGFYDTTWSTRKTRDTRPNARFPVPIEVVMGTRWHHDDIIGHAAYEEDEDGVRRQSPAWCVLNIPALCDDPETDPLGREVDEAHPNAAGEGPDDLKRKRQANPRVFSALFQGRPTAESGNLIPNTFNTYSRRATGTEEETFVFDKLTGNAVDGSDNPSEYVTCSVLRSELVPFTSFDMASTTRTTSDFTVGFNCLYSREHHALFLVDRYRERITTDQYERVLIPFIRGNGSRKVLVENMTFGQAFGQTLRNKYRLQAEMYPAVADKVARATASGLPDMMGRMQLYVLPGVSWREQTEAELGDFPNGEHDDIVDTLAAAAQFVSDMPRYRAPKEPKPRTLADDIDEHVEKQARRRQKQDPWSRISRTR